MVVLQNNIGDLYCPTLIVAPITSHSQKKLNLPTHYYAKYILGVDACSDMVLLEQIRTIDKCRVSKYLGKMSSRQMDAIGAALEDSLALCKTERMVFP